MKSFVACIALVLCVSSSLLAVSADVAQSARYTDLNDGTVMVENGLLYTSVGFQYTTVGQYSRTALRLSSKTLTAIDGKTLISKDVVDIYKQSLPDYFSKFRFSKGAYEVNGALVYIITVAKVGDDPAPTVSVRSAHSSVLESPKKTNVFQLTLLKPARNEFAVQYEWSGTAKTGEDYEAPFIQVVIFPKGSRVASVVIKPLADKLKEGTERLTLNLKPYGGYRVGGGSSASVSIKDP